MPRNHQRRSFLSLTATAITGILAGCLSAFDHPDLRIRNTSDETQEITVTITAADTDTTILEDTFRIHPGGPHLTAQEVFPNPGTYNVCASTPTGLEQCESWTVDRQNPKYHITVTTGDNDLDGETDGQYFTMGRLG